MPLFGKWFLSRRARGADLARGAATQPKPVFDPDLIARGKAEHDEVRKLVLLLEDDIARDRVAQGRDTLRSLRHALREHLAMEKEQIYGPVLDVLADAPERRDQVLALRGETERFGKTALALVDHLLSHSLTADTKPEMLQAVQDARMGGFALMEREGSVVYAVYAEHAALAPRPASEASH